MLHDRIGRNSHSRKPAWRNRRSSTRRWLASRGVVAMVAGLPGIAVLAVPQLTGAQVNLASYHAAVPTPSSSAVNHGGGNNADKAKAGKANADKANADLPKADKAKDGTTDGGMKPADGRKDDKGEPAPLPCDPNALIVAILKANADGKGDLRLADRCTYTLTAVQAGNGLPPITVPLTIDGNKSTIVRAASVQNFRIFDIAAGGNLTLHDAVVVGGLDVSGNGGGAMLVERGGAATVIDTRFTDNRTNQSGGAIRNFGSLTIKHSSFADNTVSLFDGGAVASEGALLTIEESTFERNFAGRRGGGVWTSGSVLNMTRATVKNNQAITGAGLFVNGPSTVVGSTISDNRASDQGGGVFTSITGPVAIRDSLIKANTAVNGAGIMSNSSTTVEDTRILENFASDEDSAILAFATMVLRHSEVKGNRAVNGIAGIGVGATGIVSVFDTVISENSSGSGPGGVGRNAAGVLTFDPKSIIINNRPTNCVGSSGAVTGCFG